MSVVYTYKNNILVVCNVINDKEINIITVTSDNAIAN
jgi:hypothetical protein